MSWQAMDAIDRLPYDATKEMEFRVLTKLANVAGQDGTRAWRFIPEMADELGVHERSIRRALSALVDKNLIRKGDQRAVAMWRGDRRPTVYDINMGAAEHLTTVPQSIIDDRTEFSTGDDDRTDDRADAAQQGELRKLTNSSNEDSQTEPVTPFTVEQCTTYGRKGHRPDRISGYCYGCGQRVDS